MSKNKSRKARRYAEQPETRYTVASSWPDTVTCKKQLNYQRMHRSTKAKFGMGAH